MTKKILLSLAAVVVVVGGVAALSAFEAHIINVTAHIENALKVPTDPIPFGTVFPQEYLERQFQLGLSDSFKEEKRVDDVEYVIKQKLKPCPLDPTATTPTPIDPTCVRDTATSTPHNPTGWHYLNLCPFLSKVNTDEDGNEAENDKSHPSYYVVDTTGDSCQNPGPDATGRLAKSAPDLIDTWIVDLKVPPVKGYVGQDWPPTCAGYVVESNDKTYGCDLWIEVTRISESPIPTPIVTPIVTPVATPI